MYPDDPLPAGDEPQADRGHRRIRRVARGVGRGARGVGRGAGASARVTGRATQSAYRLARRASRAEGAGESGLSRLVEVGAVNAAGDATVAIALAGSLFFQVPSGEARGQVGLFLLLTMLPFAVIAPLVGPFLDRFRRGRRWAIGGTMALRAFLCWVLAQSVTEHSAWQFPAALGVLIASKAYNITRSAATPRLVPRQLTLVKANGRLSLAGVAGAALAAPIAGGLTLLGAQWTLRFGFLVFILGTVLSILLPARVDSAAGEEEVSMLGMAGAGSGRRLGPRVVTALRANTGLRALSGFLTIFMAFLLREVPFPGWENRMAMQLVLVIGAAGVGSAIGTFLGSVVRSRPPQVVVLGVLILDAVVAVAAALFFGPLLAMALGLTVGLCQQLGKLSLDALIQDEVAEQVRTSVFARSETLLQLAWVLGGGLGIVLPLNAGIGLGVAAGLLVLWLALVLYWRSGRTMPVPVAANRAAGLGSRLRPTRHRTQDAPPAALDSPHSPRLSRSSREVPIDEGRWAQGWHED